MPAELWWLALASHLIHNAYSQGSAELSLSSTAVYSGDQVTLTCRYEDGLSLAFVNMEAYNATSKVGFLWCSVVLANTTGSGVFSGKIFSRCPALSVGATSVSVTMTVTPALQLDYNCSARVLNSNGDALTVNSLTASLAVLPAKAMACGSLVSGFGLLRSINYPNDYIDNYRCSWVLQPSPSTGLIKLDFLSFVTETCCDFLTIYNESGTPIMYSGTLMPMSLTLGNRANVTFATDSSSVMSGFAIEMSTIAKSIDCGGLVSGFGKLQSVNYPHDYNDRISCTWLLQASPPGGVIHMDFVNFSTESCCDFVNIYSKHGALLFSYSGTVLPPSLTLGSQVTVIFTTDGSIVYSGFSILVSTIVMRSLPCGSIVNGLGMLQSINYPLNYSNSHSCPWTLQPSQASRQIHLEFLTFSTESCCDYVKIYNTSGTLLFSYSGTVPPPSLILEGSTAIIFTTDSSIVSSGFSITVSTIGTESPACGSLVSGSGLIQSINYPNSYVNNHSCSWTVQASPGSGVIYLEFLTFATELCCDFVQIYNPDGAMMFSYSGTSLPPSLTLDSQATVIFKTDSSVVNAGFSIKVSTTGTASVTFNINPVYIGEPVTITCSYGTEATLSIQTLEALHETHKHGFLWCSVQQDLSIGDGVLAGLSFIGCPIRSGGSTNASVSMVASLSLDLAYSCSATIIDRYGNATTITSLSNFLEVRVLPSTPKFLPSPIVFNESDDDDAIVSCDARNGKPVAVIKLTIRALNGREATANGSVMTLPQPLRDWHNAVASCEVTNHNFANMTVSSLITINYIMSLGVPNDINTDTSSATLDCSSYVRSHPGVYYKWSVPPNTSTAYSTLLSGAIFTVLRGQTGLFNCTATNNVTMDSVTVFFNASSGPSVLSAAAPSSHSSCDLCWIIAPVIGSLVIFAVLFGLLCKRMRFLNRNPSRPNTSELKLGTLSSEQCSVTEESLKTVEERYVSSPNSPPASEHIYEQVIKSQNLDDKDVYEVLSP